jgi:mRNA-degrading endonuclease RelE of RelBE toxin-antitoxin system
VLQIVFNEISAAEMSRMPTLLQLELLNEFKVNPEDLHTPDGETFGTLEREGQKLHRYRAGDYRIYFAVEGGNVVVHRVVHKNTLKDFFYRSGMTMSEDEELSHSKHFWKLIDEGRNARPS